MALSTTLKTWLNHGLAPLGLKLDTLTRERAESDRILALDSRGHFSEPVFPVLPAMAAADPAPILNALRMHSLRFDDLVDRNSNSVGYSFSNDYFSSPDAEVLYCMIRHHFPRRIVEIGCGNSTRISRLAIEDAGIETTLSCVDPHPREDVCDIADEVHPVRVEALARRDLFDSLASGDILFIDSSHDVKIANDTVHLYLEVIPRLASGVLIHIHDIFLPYEYRRDWLLERAMAFNEQYLVQAMLQESDRYEILWAGYHLQRTMADFRGYFAHLGERTAQSLWLRRR